MTCPRCGTVNGAGRRFCAECGSSLALACASCGFSNEPGAKFCGGCGAALAVSSAVATPRFAAPDSYTPKHLAEKIITSKAALEGERKQVTVLFADLKGSMELLADRDPEEARKILDPVLERMMEAVHRYEGTVNQVMGDGIMALFGAPVANEDHAVRACYAALGMQDAIRRYSEDLRRAHGADVQIRVGLNSGEVVVRAIGSDLHMDYTAVGQTTHLAARMEQLALPGTIRLTAETLHLVEGYVQVKALGPVPIKGLGKLIEVFELTGAGGARTRLEAAARRGLTRFVGRDAELAQLRDALDRANSGHGQVVAVVGEPGVGKSRLFWELAHSHRTQGWLIVESSSLSWGKATPYLPVIDLLKAYFKVQDRDQHREVREKVSGKLVTLDESLVPTLPAFLALLGVPVDDPQWQRLDPPQRRQRTLEAVKRALLRETQVQPLLVVFEDLQWIDSETQALLDSLVESTPTARLLLFVNFRPEYEHRWSRKTYYTQLRLDPLPPETAHELLHVLLGNDTSVQPLKQVLIERTEGNPFFLEESVRMLVETKVLLGERSAYRLATTLLSIQVPATVQAVLAARIDRLPSEEKSLLQSAAVIGKDVPFVLLQEIAGVAEEELRRSLARLQAAEFLYEASLFPDLEYTFKHALTHEVAYGSVLQERRRDLHAQAVDAVERLYADRLMEQIERLAHHAFRGDLWGKAVTYLRQAGAKASAHSAYREAVACLERALEALHHLPESRETLERAVDLRFDLRGSLFPLGELETMFKHLREAERLASVLDDQQRIGWASVYMSEHFRLTGHLTEARRFAQRACAVAEPLGDLSLQVAADFSMGSIFLSDDLRQAADFFCKIAHALEGDLTEQRCRLAGFPAVMSRSYLAFALAHLGRFDEGVAHGHEGVRLAEALNHPFSLAFACWGLGELYRIRGIYSQAATLAERGLALCSDWNLTVLSVILTRLLGDVYALSGRVVEGVSLLQRAQMNAERTGRGLALTLVLLGEACILAQRAEDAEEFARRALTVSRERGECANQACALRLLGEIATHRHPPALARAESYYREALAVAGELGMRPLVAHCHLGLGRLYRRTGKREQAQEHLVIAATMYREMDVRFYLEQAEAETTGLA